MRYLISLILLISVACGASFGVSPIINNESKRVYLNYSTTEVITVTLTISNTYTLSTQKAGITHMLEHTIFISTKNFPAPFSLQEKLEREGILTTAATDYNTFQVQFQGRKDSLPTIINAINELSENVVFDEKLIENEKNVIVKEARMQEITNPLIHGIRVASEKALEGKIYPIVGYENEINNITVDELRAHYDELFALPISIDIIAPYTILEVKELFSEDEVITQITDTKIGGLPTDYEPIRFTTNPKDDEFTLALLVFPYTSTTNNDLPAKLIGAALGLGKKPLIGNSLYYRSVTVFRYGIEIIHLENEAYMIIWAYLNGKDAQKFERAINDLMLDLSTEMLDADFLAAKANLISSVDSIFAKWPVITLPSMQNPLTKDEYKNAISNLKRSSITFYPLKASIIIGAEQNEN